MAEFEGRIVLVTGAGGGVGGTVVRRWLEAGAKVFAIDASQEHVARMKADGVPATCADLTTSFGAEQAIAEASELFGPPDTLIHLAGGFGMGPTDGDDAVEIWDRMIAVNLQTSFHVFRAMIRPLRQLGGGWLVAMGSKAALQPPAKMAAYSASKAALIAMAQSMSEELKGEGIHINLILPSTIDTPANRAAMGDAAAKKWVTADDVADATMFLCSERARGLFGTTLELYGLS
jgi:NAD(P)-dependent dehydrogenase (short-subunit alcohol dehydrogenase family)